MPRLDDPKLKLKSGFKRQSLRPWDNYEDFKPTAPYPIVSQPESELVNNRETISNQLVNNKGTNGSQISKQLVNEFADKTPQKILLVNENETIGKRISKQEMPGISKQLVNELVNQELDVSLLTGHQRMLLFFIVENCKSRGLFHTSPITNEDLRRLLNTDAHTVKTTTQRLVNKGFITRQEGKRGRGGHTVFIIKKSVRDAVTNTYLDWDISKQLVNELVNQIGKQLVNKKETNRETTLPSSSSYNNINKTTTTEALAESWSIIDFSPLAEHGFTETHLRQICDRGWLSPEAAQDSIYYFAFDLAHNNKGSSIKSGPINFFMGIISKGSPYACPVNYVSPQEEKLRAYTEAKEAENKRLEELQAKAKESAFNDWYLNLSDEDIEAIFPLDVQGHMPEDVRQRLKMKHLKTHFYDNVWPEIRRKQFN